MTKHKPKFGIQTRIIRVMHPTFKDVILFEAQVQIKNLNHDLVKSIKNINIEYQLKEGLKT